VFRELLNPTFLYDKPVLFPGAPDDREGGIPGDFINTTDSQLMPGKKMRIVG